jgi:pimeloyl-ACP methyl ester carboxylesterase
VLRSWSRPGRGAGRLIGSFLDRIGLRVHTDVGEVLSGHARSPTARRAAFLHTRGRSSTSGASGSTPRPPLPRRIDPLPDRLGGAIDHPGRHARAAHRLVTNSRLEVFPTAGHFPHLDDPLRFVRVLGDFIDATGASQVDAARLGSSRSGAHEPRDDREAEAVAAAG